MMNTTKPRMQQQHYTNMVLLTVQFGLEIITIILTQISL